MIHFDLPKEKSSILKVIGIGGGGSNAVNHMFSQNIEGVNFIICNTDAQAIAQSNVPNKVQLGPHLTQGLGAGANPQIGKQATEESLEEIKRILEVNTKMAFITAGMGGGTGTGGAPIISKICKELDILTVGIVTTPFAYEGKKRQLQAEEGIALLKENVDTLLVISNDKLRHQFGNLKMKDAFAKADNVLATAAKCITDVINSTGQINVDFADVCTVMRNGGVAILGSAATEGDNRAQRAIEEALNSPLLNDNDIRGAKWILININSAEGDNEFTMDEVEIIQNYLLSHAGEDTDVILGLGYDNTLERKIGITLIATGFEHKSPFYKTDNKVAEVVKKDERIVMQLDPVQTEQTIFRQPVAPVAAVEPEPVQEEEKPAFVMQKMEEEISEVLMPKLVQEEEPVKPSPVHFQPAQVSVQMPPKKEEKIVLSLDDNADPAPSSGIVFQRPSVNEAPAQPKAEEPKVHFQPQPKAEEPRVSFIPQARAEEPKVNFIPQPKAEEPRPNYTPQMPGQHTPESGAKKPDPFTPVSGGYLSRPKNIYAEPPAPVTNPEPMIEPAKDAESVELKLVIKQQEPQDEAHPEIKSDNTLALEDFPPIDHMEEQKRKANERIQKLRNLSFNVSGSDAKNEFETVPAYIRRNLELYNTVNNVENYYSGYTVKADENNKTQISTINTFLDGKKPD
jgi:cell division protein FtsZ